MTSEDEVPSLAGLWDRYRGNPAPLVDIETSDVTLSSAIDEENIKDKQADRGLRIGMAVALTVLFLALNGVVIWLVFDQIANDRALLVAKLIQPGERLITEKVYISLISGTVVQVAAIVVAIARYLFPARNRG